MVALTPLRRVIQADSTSEEVFQYWNLPAPGWTRLLILHPDTSPDYAKDEASIECSLNHIGISDAIKHEYEALSYVWGPVDLNQNCSIRCNGKTLPVGTNLRNALSRLRPATDPRVLWIDAVCINQKDKVELAEQVARMDEIYAGARRVLVWIGDEVADEDAEDCFAIIKATNRIISSQIKGFGSLEALPPFRTEVQDPERGIPSDISRWDKVRKLMSARYFTRVWVQQEVGIASNAVILYGKSEMQWAELVELMLCTAARSDLNTITGRLNAGLIVDMFEDLWRSYGNEPSWRMDMPVTKIRSGPSDSQGLVDILQGGRYFSATDARDHVYAFLGHPSARYILNHRPDNPDSNGIVVDYTRSVDDVFLEVAAALVTSDRFPWTILSCVDHCLDSTIDFESRPSWVPYWSEGWRVYWLGVPRVWYRAGGSVNAFKTALLSDQRLRVRGVSFATIKWCSELFKSDDLYIEAMSERSGSTPVDDALEQLAAYAKDTQPRREGLEQSLEHAFSLALVAGKDSKGDRATDDLYTHRKLYRAFSREMNRAIAKKHDSPDYSTQLSPSREALEFQRLVIADNRRIFLTDTGQVGLGHGLIQVQDVCVVFQGANVPFVLRPWDSSRAPDHFKLVSESYIGGAMDGEIVELMDGGGLQERDMFLV
jgi:hypothetical protein